MRVKFLISSAIVTVLLAGCSEGQNGPQGSTSYEIASDAMPGPVSAASAERYKANEVSPVRAVAEAPVSTFAVDVDTGAYANVRRFLNHGQRLPGTRCAPRRSSIISATIIRCPTDRGAPFSVTTDVATTPWNPDTRLLRVGLRAYDVTRAAAAPANLVFLVDVSGSMDDADKLPLVKAALTRCWRTICARRTVSRSWSMRRNAGLVLPPTSEQECGSRRRSRSLEAGGSTAGGEGIQLAYATARHFPCARASTA
jgi:Ca-activated chloride channel family protein